MWKKNIQTKNHLICLVFCVLATCSHPYHTWYFLWQGILGRIFWHALSTPAIVQLWCLGMHYPLHPGGKFYPVDDGPKPSTSRLRKTPQWGWGKGRKGEKKRHHQEKETSFLNGCQTSLWLHWEWWNATMLHVITYIGKCSPTWPLSTFSTNL